MGRPAAGAALPRRPSAETTIPARSSQDIKNHTRYAFGIDDQEFMTAFECDEPADFMHPMLRLRGSEASSYTERDTPIFVGASCRCARRSRRSTAPRPVSRPSRSE